MSKTTSTSQPKQSYFIGSAAEFAIGFDGMGAIDHGSSDIVRSVTRWMHDRPYSEEITIDQDCDKPNIFMRRAVREFDLLYEYDFNTLIASAAFFEDCRQNIAPSLRSITPVSCHFGTRIRPYMFGNLRYHKCLDEKTEWSISRFKEVDSRKFAVNRTEIGRGQHPFEHETDYLTEGLTFSDLQRYNAARSVLNSLVPERLGLRIEPCEIISLGVGTTLFSAELVKALRCRKRPKAEIAGMAFSYPEISVEFI